jgi:hypothetical protein
MSPVAEVSVAAGALGQPSLSLIDRLEVELGQLCHRFAVPAEPAREVFRRLADPALRGPFSVGGRRLSGVNREGVPFEWSISAGPRPGGLRFLVDPGPSGESTSVRTGAAVEAVGDLLPMTGGSPRDRESIERMMTDLLPPKAVLDRLIMGIWVGVGLNHRGLAGLKIYVNQQFGTDAHRWFRFGAFLLKLGWREAFEHMEAFARTAGDRLEPGGIALATGAAGVGRVKLYLRIRDSSQVFLAQASTALGVEGADEGLARFHAVVAGSAEPDPRAAILSIELGPDGGPPCFKLDVNCVRHFPSDSVAAETAARLLERLELDDGEFKALIEVCAPRLSATQVKRITWLGTALRGGCQWVNFYLHPGVA